MLKKGDSQLISWVLLVGFVVGLATMVTMWTKDRAEQATNAQVEQAEQELRCAETSMNVAVDCVNSPYSITTTNTGKFTIQKIKFRQAGIFEDVVHDIAPQQTQTLNTNNINPLQEFDSIPIITINEKEVICATRKITFQC